MREKGEERGAREPKATGGRRGGPKGGGGGGVEMVAGEGELKLVNAY